MPDLQQLTEFANIRTHLGNDKARTGGNFFAKLVILGEGLCLGALEGRDGTARTEAFIRPRFATVAFSYVHT